MILLRCWKLKDHWQLYHSTSVVVPLLPVNKSIITNNKIFTRHGWVHFCKLSLFSITTNKIKIISKISWRDFYRIWFDLQPKWIFDTVPQYTVPQFRYSISTTIMMQFSMCCFTDLQMRQFGNTTRRFTYMVIEGCGCLRVFKHKFPIISGDDTDDMWNVSRFLKWITSSNRACLRKSLCRTVLVLALTTLLETLGMSWVCPVILKLPGVSILVFGPTCHRLRHIRLTSWRNSFLRKTHPCLW